ncbi:MAG: 5'-methylthioadenosine/adenosylhomocysteine nucleosidase [Gammaproteobacteria bacterium]|nr:5'-methylthioadenosine/adenosylhomocysteine nucleosidase [Gammaproteobacteria bacterium]
MALGLLSALPEEQEYLLKKLPGRTVRVGGRDYWLGSINFQDVILVLSGIGKVAAATTTVTLIEHFHATWILMMGVAGGLASYLNRGDLVLGTELVQHDLNASPFFPRYYIPHLGLSHLTTHQEMQHHLASSIQQTLQQATPIELSPSLHNRIKLYQGLMLTGDQFLQTHFERDLLLKSFPKALTIDMESAAVAQVCADHEVPFLVLRSISDIVGQPESSMDYSEYLMQHAGPLLAWLIYQFLSERKH